MHNKVARIDIVSQKDSFDVTYRVTILDTTTRENETHLVDSVDLPTIMRKDCEDCNKLNRCQLPKNEAGICAFHEPKCEEVKENFSNTLKKGYGIKYDDNKPRLAEMFIDFCIPMEELCKVWTFGANKYEKSNWKQLDNAIDRYTNAMLRHLVAEEKDLYDDESTYLHAAHIAFNALARLYFIKLKEQQNG